MSGDDEDRLAALAAENLRLRREVQSAREEAENTARLVAEQWIQIEETMSPAALTLIGDWVLAVTKRP